MERVFAAMQKFCTSNDLRMPSKDMVGRVIKLLFKAEPQYATSNKTRTTLYRNIIERLKSEPQEHAYCSESVQLPDNCCAVLNDDSHLTVSCPINYILNGEQLYCSAIFHPDGTYVYINNIKIETGLNLSVQSENILGIIFLMQNISLCKGLLSCEVGTYPKGIVEDWSTPTDELQERRTRSKSCTIYISWHVSNNTCSSCNTVIKRHLRNKTKKEMKITNLRDDHIDARNNNENEIELTKEDDTDMCAIVKTVMSTGVPENFRILLESQINCRDGINKCARRWDKKIISACLNLYCRSPRAYVDFKDSGLLVLPSTKILQYYKNSVKQTTGINKDNISWMKRESETQCISSFGKHGGLIIDEMTIQDDLVIKRKGDAWELVGAVDMGGTNNNIDVIINGRKKAQLATHSLQVVFRGHNGFRWPVAYFGSCPATAHQLYNIFWACVDEIDEAGFCTDYVMMDGASTNRAFSNMLFAGNPRDSNYATKDIFDPEHTICVIQDIMHCLKKIRNNIASSVTSNECCQGRYLILHGLPIVWEQWKDAFAYNYQAGIRIHRKLTKEHIDLTPASKMRNHLALQVLDKDMLYLMRAHQSSLKHPEVLQSAVALLEKTSILVDIFSDVNRPISCSDDIRIQQITEVVCFFSEWEKEISQCKLHSVVKHLFTQETRDDIMSSLVGFTEMCRQLLYGGNGIVPGYFNSDIVENLFCQQRGIRNGLNTNPTLAQYGPSNNAIILGQTTVSSKSNSFNKADIFQSFKRPIEVDECEREPKFKKIQDN